MGTRINKVAIIMGSQSDWETLSQACTVLEQLNVGYETHIVSAHRTPKRLYDFASTAHQKGIKVIIAGAGGAAHLPGMAAALTHLPVIAVPVESKSLKGIDSLLSIVQMLKGVAVATQAIGKPGAFNAGLMAAQILACSDPELEKNLTEWRNTQTESVSMEVIK